MRIVKFALFSFLLLFSISATAQITSLTLEDALGIAMQNSPDIQRSRLNLERSRQSLRAQQAALKSRFSLSITPYDYTSVREFNTFYNTWNTNEISSSLGDFSVRQPIKWTDGTLMLTDRLEWQNSFSEFKNERSKSYSNNLYLSYNQPIFTYNKTRLDLRELELDFENTALSFALQQLSLEYQITLGFYNVYKNKMSYQISQEEYNNQEQSYQIIKNKVDAGLSAKEELYQAELNLATSKSTMQNALVTLESSMDEFKRQTGIDIMKEIDVVADVSHQPVPVEMEKALATGQKNRMELRQRNIDIENAYADLTRTKAQNEFKGDVNLTYGIIGTNERYQDMYDQSTKNQKVSVSFEIPLFDWGERKARIKAAEATLKNQQLSQSNQSNDIIIGIRQAIRDLQNQEVQIEIERQNVRNAELTYQINLEKYKNGDLTSMDLNLVQTQLSDRKTSYINSLISYKLALLNLKIESMWDFVKNEPVVPDLSDIN
ncbi:MAG TPA: TolC family protein [bacterium]|nr:TolC family protein [bacterium]HPN43682.1 TolC family protein [bacterium]